MSSIGAYGRANKEYLLRELADTNPAVIEAMTGDPKYPEEAQALLRCVSYALKVRPPSAEPRVYSSTLFSDGSTVFALLAGILETCIQEEEKK